MKKIAPFLLLFLLAAAAVAWWQRAPTPEKPAKAKPPVPVKVARAEARSVPVLLDLLGRGEASASVNLKPRVDGVVETVDFQEGRQVKAGDVLIHLDPADHLARAKLAAAHLVRDQALLDKANADVARYQGLLEKQFVSQEKVADMRAAAAAASATVDADQAALDLAWQQLTYCKIKAPFAGVVGARLVHPGAAVKANETQLAVLNRVNPLQVSFAVPEKYLAALQAQRARGALMAEMRVSGASREVVTGKVVFFDNAVDPATATLRLKAEVTNPAGVLTPGQFFNVSLRIDTLENAVVIPAGAVQQGPDGSFVYVLDAEGGAKMRKVTVAQVRVGQAALTQGLAAGESVVTDGHSRLTPGTKVKRVGGGS